MLPGAELFPEKPLLPFFFVWFSTFEVYSKFKLTSIKFDKDNVRGNILETKTDVSFGSSED